MNIKEQLTAFIQETDSRSRNKLSMLSKGIGLVSELQDDKCIIPENVLSDLTNEQQRAVLLFAMVGAASMIQEDKL